jgi:hypothetical protein
MTKILGSRRQTRTDTMPHPCSSTSASCHRGLGVRNLQESRSTTLSAFFRQLAPSSQLHSQLTGFLLPKALIISSFIPICLKCIGIQFLTHKQWNEASRWLQNAINFVVKETEEQSPSSFTLRVISSSHELCIFIVRCIIWCRTLPIAAI